jgi:Protein of unknown function (DUF4230)
MTATLRLLFRLIIVGVVVGLVVVAGLKFLDFDKPAETVVRAHTVLEEMTAIGKLELVRYNFKDVVEYEKGATDSGTLNRFLPNAKAVLIISGEAVGCIDLTKIQPQDVVEDSLSVTVYLPPPELCVYKIDHQHSRVYDLSNGYFVEKGKMVSEAYQAAEKQIEKSALDMGILAKTNENAEKMLAPMLAKIAGKKILLRHRN